MLYGAGGQARGRRMHHPALSSLPLQCDDAASGLPPAQEVLAGLQPPQRENLTAFLQLVGYSVQDGRPSLDSDPQLFTTAYVLVSRLAGTARLTVVATGTRGSLLPAAGGQRRRSARSPRSHRASMGAGPLLWAEPLTTQERSPKRRLSAA